MCESQHYVVCNSKAAYSLLKVSRFRQSRSAFPNPVRDPIDHLLGAHTRTTKEFVRLPCIAKQSVGRLCSFKTNRLAELFPKLFCDMSNTEQLRSGNIDQIGRR